MSEEKLNELKEKVANLQEEIRELTPEELEQVFGGAGEGENRCRYWSTFVNMT